MYFYYPVGSFFVFGFEGFGCVVHHHDDVSQLHWRFHWILVVMFLHVAFSAVKKLLGYYLVGVLHSFQVQYPIFIMEISSCFMEHLVELVDWIFAKHQEECRFSGTAVGKVDIACCCHWCQLIPFQSMVDVLCNAGFEESVESFYLPIALRSVWWQMDRHFCSKLGNNFLEGLVLELSPIVHQDLHTSSKCTSYVVLICSYYFICCLCF